MFFEERRKFRNRAREQVIDHGRRLRNAELELQRLRDEEQSLRAAHDPSPEDMVMRAVGRGRRLFERRLGDADFLNLRLGTGLAPSVIEIDYRDDRSPDSGSLPPDLEQMRREGRHIADQYQQVPDVPICFDLKKAGAVGVAGRYARTAPLARALLGQMAVQHSPDDLRIVGFLGARPLDDWAWLKWLPHTRNGGVGEAPTSLAWDESTRQSLGRWLFDELTARKRALDDGSPFSGAESVVFPWLVLFVDDLRLTHTDPALRLALADGLRVRVAILGLADDVRSVPGGCGGVAAVERMVTYAETTADNEPLECVADAMTVDDAERLARALAPLDVLDVGAAAGSGDIPTRISFFESLGIANVEQLDVAEAWRLPWPSGRGAGGEGGLLCTPLGPTSGGETLWLDLKEQSLSGHGPHGLVAGTTGAGKSELLLTLIAGLAMRNPPDVLNFVLVDYKGGDAFQTVANLPHTIALITDLDSHLAARALVTLRSEIKRREHRLLELRAAGVSSLADFQSRRSRLADARSAPAHGDPSASSGEPWVGQDPMPFLVIVVDEFARLKDELPEFISGLIDVARVGRSLGVHLILATQTPSGTVDDQIQKNSNFGISLRVRDHMDSKQVIGEPDAALIPGSLPGRGYFRAGLEPVQLFQTARVGATYIPRANYATFEVVPFEPRPGAVRRLPMPNARGGADATHLTEVRALTAYLRDAAERLGVTAPRWPAPLPDVVALIGTQLPDPELAPPALLQVGEEIVWPSLPAGDWLVAPIGLVDEPTQQAQGPFRLDVSRNCMVFGGAGSGKSTLLRTLAASLAITHSPRDLHLYCLDFDARTLAILAGLPHCGDDGVFFPRDSVRVRRLVRMLEHELTVRREAGVTNLRQQRRASGDHTFERFPFIVVLLDNFAAFRETFEEEENLTRSMDSMVADVASLMRDGPAAGIQFVITTGAGASIPNAILNAAETRVALRLTEATDYSIVGRLESVPERLPPGRGFAVGTPPREFQVALLPDEVEAATELTVSSARTAHVFARVRRAAGDIRPPAVQDLPAWLSLDDSRLAVGSLTARPLIALGLDDERSRAVVIDLAELLHLIVLGPAGSGKTSLLASCVLQVLERSPSTQLFLVLPRPSALSELSTSAACQSLARNTVQLGELLDDLEVVVDERREALRSETGADDPPPPLLLVLDDYELLRQDDDFYELESRLARIARRGTAVGLHVLLGGSNIELRDARDDLVRYISQLRVGVLLQPDIEFDGDVFSVRLRRMVEAAPVGRGYLVVRQQQLLFQAATPQVEGEPLAVSLARRLPEL
ncbi:MAG TPA: FtsK/SpoIIIE domain-containing protein, partial [Chloroflexota bacterium]|nr:FtsK/SpoIIIE domain-containing protein [Chloroflexota bacterium]